MSIFRTEFDEVVEADLDALIADDIREGLSVEYKRDMYGNADADKREFLKDLSSFANSAGGHLVIGISDVEGVAAQKSPINGDPDQHLQRLENLVRAGLEPRIVGIRMRPIPIAGGGHVYLLRIPKSWNPPHRVTLQGTNRFFVRSSAGAHEVSVEELRVLFASGATMRDRLVSYRRERLGLIAANEGVVPLSNVHGKLVLHIVPLSAFGNEHQVDVTRAREVRNRLTPMSAEGFSPRINFDGFANIRPGNESSGYTQIFRSGIIEATKVRVSMTYQPDQNRPALLVIPTLDLGRALFTALPMYLQALKELEVSPPFVIMVSLLGIRGALLGIGRERWLRLSEQFGGVL